MIQKLITCPMLTVMQHPVRELNELSNALIAGEASVSEVKALPFIFLRTTLPDVRYDRNKTALTNQWKDAQVVNSTGQRVRHRQLTRSIHLQSTTL